MVVAAASMLICLTFAEALLALGLRHPPGWSAGPVRGLIHRIHIAADWPMVQYTPACARWDSELTYTLRPPGCTITDREFTVRYEVNAAGLRDDDASLAAPRLIVLGDSYAMGWGVAQDAAFPQRLEQRLGIRVLNAGVPSYGTARELRLLRRLDASAAGAIVVQFCWNDVAENRAWVEGGGQFPTSSRETYDRLIADHARSLSYYPFKHLVTLLGMLRAERAPSQPVAPSYDPLVRAAEDLLALLTHGIAVGTPVVVLVSCERETAVGTALRAALASGRHADLASRVTVVDPSPTLRPEHIYPLDGHWTAAGHAMVADLVATELLRRHLP